MRRLIAALLVVWAGAAAAQGVDDPGPTLARIRASHTVRLGYRDSSPPFAFVDPSGRPVGYSLDLCEAIVEQIGAELDDAELHIDYVKVTSDSRMPAVLQGDVDLECGSTTANAERARQVAFSPLIFVAGTRLMVAKGSAVGGIADLRGKTIVVTSGTTNAAAIRALDAKLGLGLRIAVGADHEQSFQMLADGRADAFATDDVLLYGLIARHRAQDRFRVVGDLLSYEPYGIMFRRDEPVLAGVVDRSFRDLASNGDLMPIYRKWFQSRLPTGERLNLPISPQLEQSFAALDAARGNEN